MLYNIYDEANIFIYEFYNINTLHKYINKCIVSLVFITHDETVMLVSMIYFYNVFN